MKLSLVFIGVFFYSFNLFAQISDIVPTAISIANTSVSDSKSISAFTNPSLIAYVDKSAVGIEFENRFLLSELSTKSLQAAYSTDIVNLGLSFSHFGYSLYHEMLIGMGFARNFSDKFALGLQLNYYTVYLSASNEYKGALLPQIGFHVNLSTTFSLGVNVFNPFQSNITTELTTKRIPSVFSFGSQYFLSPDLVWRVQMDKEISSNYRLATGFEYSMLNYLTIKIGAYGSDYLVPCLGFCTKVGAFRFHLNGELHPLLGLNTLAALTYRFSE